MAGMRRRVAMPIAQNAAATSSPRPPMIGRKTSGGLEMTSRPLIAATGVALGLSDGDDEGEAVADGDGDGDADGEGEVEADSVKVAHGPGGTLAQSLCWPGGSPANGFTCVVKLPLESAVAEPATLL
jgi:hypothetical protein